TEKLRQSPALWRRRKPERICVSQPASATCHPGLLRVAPAQGLTMTGAPSPRVEQDPSSWPCHPPVSVSPNHVDDGASPCRYRIDCAHTFRRYRKVPPCTAPKSRTRNSFRLLRLLDRRNAHTTDRRHTRRLHQIPKGKTRRGSSK